jgi:hypothetical protein
MIHWLVKKSNSLRSSLKDILGCKVLGIYCIPCECSKAYVGQTGGFIAARCKEHECHIWLNQPEKSAVTEHCKELGHRIVFNKNHHSCQECRWLLQTVKRSHQNLFALQQF